MIKSFSHFILENNSNRIDTDVYIRDIISMITSSNQNNIEYSQLGKKEYIDPYYFDLKVYARFTDTPSFQKDPHFKSRQWEELNFNKHGFSIDANFITESSNSIPTLIITLVINPNVNYLKELNFRLVDVLVHEINHMKQIGWNKRAFKAETSSQEERHKSKKDFNYFLLPEEMESMVRGMYYRSKKEGKDINTIFNNYLYPFIEDGFISDKEYDIIFKKWMIYALETYPDINVSISDKKISEIIDSL